MVRSSRIRVPLFAFCAVIAPTLVGALYAAEALMGPPPPMTLASAAPVLVQRHAIQTDGIQVLTVQSSLEVPASALAPSSINPGVRVAVEPTPVAQTALVSEPMATPVPASMAPAVQADETPRKTVAVAAPKKKKPVKVARPWRDQQDRGDRYAYEPRQRPFLNFW